MQKFEELRRHVVGKRKKQTQSLTKKATLNFGLPLPSVRFSSGVDILKSNKKLVKM